MHKIFDCMSKQELKDAITGATAKFSKIYSGEGTVPSGLIETLSKYVSPTTASAIAAAIASCKGVKEVDFKKDRLTFVQFAAVVPTRRHSDHSDYNYVVGDPVIMIVGTEGGDSGMRGMKKDGNIGVLLPRYRRSLRPATAAEIESIVNAVYNLS